MSTLVLALASWIFVGGVLIAVAWWIVRERRRR